MPRWPPSRSCRSEAEASESTFTSHQLPSSRRSVHWLPMSANPRRGPPSRADPGGANRHRETKVLETESNGPSSIALTASIYCRRIVKRPKLPARRPPQLLALVYLITIVLVVTTAVALSTVVGDGISTTPVNASLAADRALVTAFVQSNMTAEEVATGDLSPERVTQLGAVMSALADTGIVPRKRYNREGPAR